MWFCCSRSFSAGLFAWFLSMYVLLGKRVFDIIFSLISLIFLFPLFIIVAILILIFDSRPIFFKQKRIGIKGKVFYILKFRSMPVGTKNLPSDKIGKIQLGWVGYFIRRTNIDELPQLINILKNEMSIVGPRPSTLFQKKLIKLRKKNKSFFLKPGLTGLAQINSYDGMSVYKKANFDGKYVNQISLYVDVKIIFKTFFYLLKKPPIY